MLLFVIGTAGFEPAASCAPSRKMPISGGNRESSYSENKGERVGWIIRDKGFFRFGTERSLVQIQSLS